jgi:hypothetical protein
LQAYGNAEPNAGRGCQALELNREAGGKSEGIEQEGVQRHAARASGICIRSPLEQEKNDKHHNFRERWCLEQCHKKMPQENVRPTALPAIG